MVNKAGCQRILLMVLAAVMVVLVATVVAVKHIGWWAGVLVVITAIVLANYIVRWAIKRAIGRLAMMPFTIKSSVLRDAGVEIHRVEKVARPKEAADRGFVDSDGSRVTAHTVKTAPNALPPGQDVIDPRHNDVEEAAPTPIANDGGGPPKTYWRIDVTLTPREGQSQMTHWDPGEMVLVRYNSKTSFEGVKAEEGIYPASVEIFGNGGWTPDEGVKLVGRGRVRYTFPLPLANDHRRWKLRYYFEGLGDVRLPD